MAPEAPWPQPLMTCAETLHLACRKWREERLDANISMTVHFAGPKTPIWRGRQLQHAGTIWGWHTATMEGKFSFQKPHRATDSGSGTGPWESPSTDAARSVFRKRQCTYFEPYEAHGGYAASWAAIRIPSILLDGMPGSGTHLIPCLGFPGLPWCSVVPRLSST